MKGRSSDESAHLEMAPQGIGLNPRPLCKGRAGRAALAPALAFVLVRPESACIWK